jgi:arylsulfatase A-like enzyme
MNIALGTISCVLAADPSAGTAGNRTPNVIVILTDDQGYGDLSCHGNPVLTTPNLDRRHRESIRLTDFHVAPLCIATTCACGFAKPGKVS